MIDKSSNILVIPTYNEAGNIDNLLSKIANSSAAVEILFVDDNSSDGTQQKIALHHSPFIHILKRKGKLGLASAYMDGFKWALERGYQYIVQMDADLSHQPKYVSPMLNLLESGKADFVIGSRNIPTGGVENWGYLRKFISKFGSFYARTILSTPIFDFTGGYNAWNSSVLQYLVNEGKISSKGYSFQIELKYKAFQKGFKHAEHPIIFPDRTEGQSKMNSAIVLEAIWKTWMIRFG